MTENTSKSKTISEEDLKDYFGSNFIPTDNLPVNYDFCEITVKRSLASLLIEENLDSPYILHIFRDAMIREDGAEIMIPYTLERPFQSKHSVIVNDKEYSFDDIANNNNIGYLGLVINGKVANSDDKRFIQHGVNEPNFSIRPQLYSTRIDSQIIECSNAYPSTQNRHYCHEDKNITNDISIHIEKYKQIYGLDFKYSFPADYNQIQYSLNDNFSQIPHIDVYFPKFQQFVSVFFNQFGFLFDIVKDSTDYNTPEQVFRFFGFYGNPFKDLKVSNIHKFRQIRFYDRKHYEEDEIHEIQGMSQESQMDGYINRVILGNSTLQMP